MNVLSHGHEELFVRSLKNPILEPDEWPYPIESVFNAAALQFKHEVLLLCRVADRRGISHFTLARSHDGLTNWRVDPKPFMVPNPKDPTEQWGIEDPRVTWVDELQAWVIVYTTYGPKGVTVAIATTKDFVNVERYGPVLPPEDKDATLFPRRINGKFALLHRPMNLRAGSRADIVVSYSDDLRSWHGMKAVLHTRPGPWWDSVRIGIGPPPLEVDAGWLVMYHGVKVQVSGCVYKAGIALLDKDNPSKVVQRCDHWVFGPQAPYERLGEVPNVVFPCGWVYHQKEDAVHLYYGAADTSMAVASASMSKMLDHMKTCSDISADKG